MLKYKSFCEILSYLPALSHILTFCTGLLSCWLLKLGTVKVELHFCRFELQLHLGHQSCRAISLYNVYLSVHLGPIWKPTLG